ncbi:hypothetical protein PSQ19_05100 [Devosia algicola]|uniref:Transcription elongation factor GreA/GreB C-terminal domain-containing protein n=1 Tax=Devosia algicola TaxID=3026418 RepID=A0ABY7YQ74_9HYPH|nr:hypothetical protein [Devosia algicola]WDR03479.1 hypothetical protein PSQ19_05100 [Devosia algicola]
MITSARPMLTVRDHAILTGLARQGGLGSAAYYDQLQQKLGDASIVELVDVDPDLATFGSFVRYRVNGGRPLEHKLLLHPRWGSQEPVLSIKSFRGLGLLGMREGQIFAVNSHDPEQCEALELEIVLFQPEADGVFTMAGSAAR